MKKGMSLRIVIIFIFTFCSLSSFSQGGESLFDLFSNTSLFGNNKKSGDNFIYEIDTISLPIIDDFTRDRFKKYVATENDPNVTDTLFYQLFDATDTNPMAFPGEFMTDTTFRIFYDTASTADTIVIINKTALPSQLAWYYDISSYPITKMQIEIWPPYEIYDSSAFVSGDIEDTLYIAPTDVLQDTLRYYFVSPGSDSSYWVDDFACMNSRYPINPPTYGVATFDGLSNDGMPYVFPTFSDPSGIADYMTSKPIRMSDFTPSDSVYFSFFFQSTGLGNSPEVNDSLVLEFWVPDSNEWIHIWATPGIALDSFQYVHIPVTEAMYFEDGFKFRFYNYASLSGNLDHWHLDYVYFSPNRSIGDTLMNDLAFITTPRGMLETYYSIPWDHYKLDPSSDILTETNLISRNMHNQPKDAFGGSIQVLFDGNLTQTVLKDLFNPTAPAFGFNEAKYVHTLFEYDTSLADTCAVFDLVYSSVSPSTELLRSNDTITYKQVFSSYYALDDGSAEAGYGIVGSNAQVAQKFEVAQQDSIRSILIHFTPMSDDVSGNLFRLSIWNDIGGEPGNLLYQTPALYAENPIYLNKKNGFVIYHLHEMEHVAVNGTYYVGFEQIDSDPLNVGFDLNTNNQNRIFYKTGTDWFNTSFEGTLMIRPDFVSGKAPILSLNEKEKLDFELYPNPTSDFVNLRIDGNIQSVQLIDMSGRVVREFGNQNQLNLEAFSAGIYFIKVTNSDGVAGTKKLVIR